jgi:hypothetical protein
LFINEFLAAFTVNITALAVIKKVIRADLCYRITVLYISEKPYTVLIQQLPQCERRSHRLICDRVNPNPLYSSIFTNQTKKPNHKLFWEVLGEEAFEHWTGIRDYVCRNSPGAEEVWYFFKVGWHIRIKSNKRVVIYCIPAENYFVVLLVLSERAMREALACNLTDPTRQVLENANSHSEGYSFYIAVKDEETVKDIKKLVAIKLFAKS